MTQVNEHLERLICRRLDGELTADEQLELDRELLRNPAAREVLESYAAIDAVAADVLRECAGQRETPHLVVPAASANTARAHHRAHHGGRWMLVASALAACLALVVFLQTPPAGERPATSPPELAHSTANHAGRSATIIPTVGTNKAPQMERPGEGGIWPASVQAPRELDRSTQRNLLLITDDAGNVYLLNVDHIREVERDADPGGLEFVNNPI